MGYNIIRRYFVVVLVAIITVIILDLYDPIQKPQSVETPEIILDATMTPVLDAPDGTYIIEYSNGHIEVLHPDGTRAPLVKIPHHHEVDRQQDTK